MTKYFPQLYNQPEDDRGTRENRKLRRGNVVEVFPAIRPAIINVYKKVDPKFINQKIQYERFSPISKMTSEQKAKYKAELLKAEERENESLKKHLEKQKSGKNIKIKKLKPEEVAYDEFVKSGGKLDQKMFMEVYKKVDPKTINKVKYNRKGKVYQKRDDITQWFRKKNVRQNRPVFYDHGILFTPGEYFASKVTSNVKKPKEKPLGKKINEKPLGKKPSERKPIKTMTDKDRELMENHNKLKNSMNYESEYSGETIDYGNPSGEEIRRRVKKLSKAISRKNILGKATKIYGGMLW